MAAEEQREDELLEDTHPFRNNAAAIIKEMKELNDSCQGRAKLLVDEILHSIFFLGKINTPPFSPLRLVNDDERFKELKEQFPRPFERYSSHLPRRSPFSCVLDMIVFLEGQENEDEIIKRLQKIISPLNKKHLVSAAICVSQNTNNQNSACRHYGVSMSKMQKASLIMISASCLVYWHSYVAAAVMTYHPKFTKRRDLNGTIKLPKGVSCKTFSLFTGGKEIMPPCKSCQNMFGLKEKPKRFQYGNCAEAESVSNLFKHHSEVMEQARPNPEKFTDGNRNEAAEIAITYLRNNLPTGFTQDIQFYNPQL